MIVDINNIGYDRIEKVQPDGLVLNFTFCLKKNIHSLYIPNADEIIIGACIDSYEI